MSDWQKPDAYRLEDDLVQVLCLVQAPSFADPNMPRECEMPISSGDHAIGDQFVSIGHANDSLEGDGLEWWVAGWNMTQDCWQDARGFEIIGWQPMATVEQEPENGK